MPSMGGNAAVRWAESVGADAAVEVDGEASDTRERSVDAHISQHGPVGARRTTRPETEITVNHV